MARKKVQLQWIMNDTARRTTYKKRMKGLMKKVKELSILCGIEACAIVHSPYDPQPEVWPPPMETVRMIREFKCRPENDHSKKRLNQENYMRQRVAKAKDQLEKQQKKNRRIEMENLMYQCQAGEKGLQDMSIKDSSDLMWSIDDQLKAVGQKMEYFHHQAPQPGGAAAQAAVPVAQKTPLEVALESLENQMLMDVAPRGPDSLVTVGYPGSQDMMHPGPHGHYEDPSFWGPPFFT